MEKCNINIERLKDFKFKEQGEVKEMNIFLGGNYYTFRFRISNWEELVDGEKKKTKELI